MSKRKHPAVQTGPSGSPLETSLERFQPLLSIKDFAALMAELERPLYPALRANPLKCDPSLALPAWAARYAWQAQPVPFCRTGIQVINSPAPVSQTPEHRMGFYYIQDAASMLPVELFDFDGVETPLILDLAASPGGKTTHLISRAADRGLVVANDSSQDRLAALRIVLQNWGATSSAVTHFPGEKFGAWFPETFDRVLLDAPCSMQGLRATEGHPLRAITGREQAALAQRQAGLLESALRTVKVEGQVVYSTCTLSPEEDEGVLDELLRRYPGACEIDDLSSRLDRPVPALASDGEHFFNPAVVNAARLWPQTFGTAGFFAARLTKLAPLPSFKQEPPSRSLGHAGFEPVERRDAVSLLTRLADQYGWDGTAFLERAGLELWQRSAVIYMLPQAYLGQFANFPVQGLGMVLGEASPDGFTVSHEWAARFGMQVTAGICRLAPEKVAAWLRGEDIQGRPDCALPAGATAIVQDEEGRLLGRGKVLSGRLKNLLPRRVVY